MFAIHSRKLDARRLYFIMSAATSVLFTLVFAVTEVYKIQQIGLNPLQLVLVGTTLELAIFLFEVPTGIVADVYSRRLSIVIGFVLIGIGFIIEGTFPAFWAVMLSQVLWGIGYTFTSGATQAWITDEVGEEQVGQVLLRSGQINNLIGIPATLVAALLGSWVLNLPIVLGGALFIVLAGFLVLYMPETGFKPTPREDRTTWQQMGHTFRQGFGMVRARPTLLAIMFIGLFIGLYSEGYDRLGTAHLLQSFTLPDFAGLQPVLWINLIGIIGGLLGTGVMRLAEKRLDLTRSRPLAWTSFAINGVIVASLLIFALAGNFVLAVVMGWVIGIARRLQEPVETTWMNQYIDSSVRATVISMRSQVDAFGQIAGGPPVGFIGERLGIRAALVASSLILSPVLYLYARLLASKEIPATSTV